MKENKDHFWENEQKGQKIILISVLRSFARLKANGTLKKLF